MTLFHPSRAVLASRVKLLEREVARLRSRNESLRSECDKAKAAVMVMAAEMPWALPAQPGDDHG